jgi:hypothetical protein
MHTRLLHGPLLLLLYQAVPVGATRDSVGRYRLTVGFGAGQWENQEFDCNGQLVSARKVPFSTGGAQLDAWVDRHVRITGFGGGFKPTPDTDSAGFTFVQDYEGPFGGAQVAYEGHYFGLGAGVIGISGYDGGAYPSFYLRGGSINSFHLRADVFPPTPTLGSTGWGRVGVGYRDGHQRRLSGFLGVAIPPLYSEEGMFTGSVSVPLAGRVALRADAIVGGGKQYSQGGVAVGIRYDFGAPVKGGPH